jgi:hypothetical protein
VCLHDCVHHLYAYRLPELLLYLLYAYLWRARVRSRLN